MDKPFHGRSPHFYIYNEKENNGESLVVYYIISNSNSVNNHFIIMGILHKHCAECGKEIRLWNGGDFCNMECSAKWHNLCHVMPPLKKTWIR